jgi:hypothetical protein
MAMATANADIAVIARFLTARAIGPVTAPQHPHSEVVDKPPMEGLAAA